MKNKPIICLVAGCTDVAYRSNYCFNHYKSYTKFGCTFKMKTYLETHPHRFTMPPEYPNKKLLDKNRMIVLERTGFTCKICGMPAKHVHHIDKTKTNHSIKNLIPVCTKCHGNFHRGRKIKHSEEYKIHKIKNKYERMKAFLNSFKCS